MRYKKSFKQIFMAALASLLIGLLAGSLTGLWLVGVGSFIVTLLIALSPESFGLGRTRPGPLDDDLYS
ncbi:hypothetical protein [Rothia nasimurium]|uniref:hypothetical protein n=1 Tax=Rothia nasimurium TaxID=85336 RepID=UPI001F450725|nr:hypothetical protein [Rothia nasimurium]